MSKRQFESIEDFAYSYELGNWKVPEPETQLSWKDIRKLHKKSLKITQTANLYDREVSDIKQVKNKYHWDKELRDTENKLTEQIMIQCWKFVRSGKKPMRVKIHDWVKDYLFPFVPFSIESHLWYKTIAWEYHHWFNNLKSDYDNKVSQIDDDSHHQLQMAHNDFSVWESTYYKQRDLFYRWLNLRGFKLSYNDFHVRLRKHVWGIIPPSYAMEDHTKPY